MFRCSDFGTALSDSAPAKYKNTQYSWHATQEHWGFSQGTTFSKLILVIILVIAFISFNICNNPGARSSIYVYPDAF